MEDTKLTLSEKVEFTLVPVSLQPLISAANIMIISVLLQ